MMVKRLRIAWIVLLAGALAACSPKREAAPAPAAVSPAAVPAVSVAPALPPPPATTRDPSLRQIGPEEGDALLLERIGACREMLPVEYRKRNNFAWAVAEIEGMDKTEFFAHSGIQSLDGLSSEEAQKIAGISTKPGEGRFQTLGVNQVGGGGGADCWQRDVDTEFKILEDIASRLPDPSAKGRIRLFTELYPCPSCWNVMKQFLAVYTNIEMDVLYRTP